MKEQAILWILDAFTNVIPYDQEKYDKVLEQIITTPQNTIISTNHASFANVPIAINELYKRENILNNKEKRNKKYTVLAPSATTQSSRNFINSSSHLLKTFTLNPRSQIPGLEKEIKQARKAFKEEMHTIREQEK